MSALDYAVLAAWADAAAARVADPRAALMLTQQAQAIREAATLRAEVERLRAENARLRGLLRRYRAETPLGHQPHMIAHEVDAALAPQEPDHG